jgi:hypothetical protein
VSKIFRFSQVTHLFRIQYWHDADIQRQTLPIIDILHSSGRTETMTSHRSGRIQRVKEQDQNRTAEPCANSSKLLNGVSCGGTIVCGYLLIIKSPVCCVHVVEYSPAPRPSAAWFLHAPDSRYPVRSGHLWTY